jgi:hypothetical protein
LSWHHKSNSTIHILEMEKGKEEITEDTERANLKAVADN